MDAHPQINFWDSDFGRRAMLAGTRLDVWQVVATLRMNDNSVEETAAYLGIGEHRIRAALAYYADYKDETDEFAARMQKLADEEEQAFRRRQEVIG